MSPLFGKKNPNEETVLVVDVENGSVGCALVRRAPGQLPKLFAETRISLPLLSTFTAHQLLKETEKMLREALVQTSGTAARMRNHPKLGNIGVIGSAHIFVAAPWASARVEDDEFVYTVEPTAANMIATAVRDTFGDVPQSMHAAMAAVMHASERLFGGMPDLLFSSLTGEMTELNIAREGKIVARATMPIGKHLVLRTVQTHGGVSRAEAESALALARHGHSGAPLEEALEVAAHTFATEFSSAAREIKHTHPMHGILLVAQEPVGEWAARALATYASTDVFGERTPVQALHSRHVMPHLAAHSARPDLLFMIEALFIDGGVE